MPKLQKLSTATGTAAATQYDDDDLDGITPLPSMTKTNNPALDDELPADAGNVVTYSLDDDADVADEYNRSGGMDFVKVGDNQTVRIAFPPGTPVQVDFVHYSTLTGYSRCNSIREKGVIVSKKSCCMKLDEAKPRRSLYVFEYIGTDKSNGKIINGNTAVAVKILRASAALWRDIKRNIDEDSTFYSHDFLLSKVPNEKATKVAIASHKNPCAWTVAEDHAEVLANAKETYYSNIAPLTKALGKNLTSYALSEILAGKTNPNASLSDIEGV